MNLFILSSCHFPLGSQFIKVFYRSTFDSRLDITNDLYGWSELPSFLKNQLGFQAIPFPLIGSRYQTASQVAFHLKGFGSKKQHKSLSHPYSFIPRSLKELDEWPNLEVSEGQGPEWPKLIKPVLYFSDNRYDTPPDFKSATCKKLGRLEKYRSQFLAKWIEVWKCDPTESPVMQVAGEQIAERQ